MPTEIPMHLPDGSLVSLGRILAILPENDWAWRLCELWATGRAPGGVDMADFEERVRSRPDGLPMSWAQLHDLAAGLDQTMDCEIVGYRDEAARSAGEWIIRIEAHDSTLWQIDVDERVVESAGVRDAVHAVVASPPGVVAWPPGKGASRATRSGCRRRCRSRSPGVCRWP